MNIMQKKRGYTVYIFRLTFTLKILFTARQENKFLLQIRSLDHTEVKEYFLSSVP